jgi:hypothetical protein
MTASFPGTLNLALKAASYPGRGLFVLRIGRESF